MPYIIFIVIALVVLFYGIWILGILFIRLLGLIFGYSVIMAGFAFIAGLVWGVVLPLRILRGRSRRQLVVASPQLVRDGKVFKNDPRGTSKAFGWDPAWPLYVPYQLRFDTAAVRAEAKGTASNILAKTRTWWPRSDRLLLRPILAITKFLVMGISIYALILGLFSGTLLWLIIVAVFQATTTFAQWLTIKVLRLREARFMKRNSAIIRCTHCYRETAMPSYRCPNPGCARVHHDVNPGPLGIRTRICECEATLPLTVASASQVLTAECPFCTEELPQGAGSRRVVVAPIFGSVGSGKTQFLSTAAISLYRMSEEQTTKTEFTALSHAAHQFLATSLDEMDAGRAPMKTQHSERPEGYPFLVSSPDSDFELHLMDAAGENFVHADDSRSLGYLDISTSLVFLHDPLTIPEIREQLSLSGINHNVQVAQGQGNDAYGSVVDRLRDSGENLNQKKLAVVVTKADIIAQILPGEPVPAGSAGVRDWLYAHGNDNLVRRIEMDFQNVEYFAVNSSPDSTFTSAMHPLRVIDWVLKNTGGMSMFDGPAVSELAPVSLDVTGDKSNNVAEKETTHS